MALAAVVKYPASLSARTVRFPRYLAMTRAVAWLAIVVFVAACHSPFERSTPKSATPQSIALQQGDVPGMDRCAISGDVTSVLDGEKIRRSPAYDVNATEWQQWKRQGAVDAYFVVYGQTPADCAAASDSTTGAPQGRLMVGLVVQFRDSNGAARSFTRDSTLLGMGPKDLRFIELAGGTTTFGAATGLGDDSVVGSAVVAGADYFVADWQSRRFQTEFIGYNTRFADGDSAVKDMNRRIQ